MPTVNVAEVVPEATDTEAGTFAPVPADKLTTTPPTGAGRERLTVPVDEFPPTMELGETDTLARSGVKTVN